MKPHLCIEPQCPATCEGCAYAVPPDDTARQLIARLLCTFALDDRDLPYEDGDHPLVDRARAYLREPGPRLWIVEHGAVGLPHGNPSRLTTFEAHDTEWGARAAALASEFNSRVFSVFVPPDGAAAPATPAASTGAASEPNIKPQPATSGVTEVDRG